MQLPQFLKEIDAVTHNLPHEDLEKLLHEMARKCPEDQREGFLQLLREYGGGNADGWKSGYYSGRDTRLGIIGGIGSDFVAGSREDRRKYYWECADWLNGF